MITSSISNVGLKKLYSLFIITGLVLLLTTFLVPQRAGAQAFVPVKDAELISAFKLFLESTVGSAGGGTYMVDGNPVEIAAEICETRTEPVISDKRSMFGTADLNNDGDTDDPFETGVYKKDWVFQDKDINGKEDGIKEWVLYPIIHRAEIDMRRSNPWRTNSGKGNGDIGPEDPSTEEIRNPDGTIAQKGYYTNPANPYFFLPNPDELTPAQVNNSISLNCLLQEMVEWQKLQINMQMHSMVKEYFTDAQTYMLSQQLLSTLAAATIKWSNEELEQRIYIDGVATTTKGAVYGDVDNVAMGVANNELAGGLDEITGGAVAKNDLGLDSATQADIAKQINDNLRERDSFKELKKRVEYTALPAGSSPAEIYAHKARNSALNVTGLIESNIAQRMSQAASKQKDQWEVYGGYLSKLDYGDDPFYRNPQIVTPGNMLGQNLYQASQSGIEALRTADEIGEGTGTSSQELSYQLQQKSLRDYKVQQLLNNQQTPQELFNEFEQVLVGYYGLGTSTTYWSRNMLVNTWDDVMWGSGAPWKAEALGKRLDEIKLEVEKYGTP